MGFGEYKHPAGWRNDNVSSIYAKLQRHLIAYQLGEHDDSESGLSHLDHAAADLAILIGLDETYMLVEKDNV